MATFLSLGSLSFAEDNETVETVTIFSDNTVHFNLDEPDKYATETVSAEDNGRVIKTTVEMPAFEGPVFITAFLTVRPIPKDPVSVADPWDRAGNMGKASQPVNYLPSPPVLELQASKQQDAMRLDLNHQGPVPLDYWYLEVWSDQEDLLKVAEGEKLPATVQVPLAELSEAGIVRGYLFAKDILGNQSRKEIQDLSQLLEQVRDRDAEADEDPTPSDSWNAEF